MLILQVPSEFINYRTDKAKVYNQRGRSNRRFLMDLDAELFEYIQVWRLGAYDPHPSWMVDFSTKNGLNVDVKFIRKYWNVSREKTLNLIKQRKLLDEYWFYEWIDKPSRPLEEGDGVVVNRIGSLSYDVVADNLKKSYKEPDGFYVDVRRLINDTNGNVPLHLPTNPQGAGGVSATREYDPARVN